MNTILIQHAMDEKPREMTLDEAFLEALQLSESHANKTEERDYKLYELLCLSPNFVKHISDGFKYSILQSWDYEIVQ